MGNIFSIHELDNYFNDTGVAGAKGLVIKDEDQGVMISIFQYREFGLGMESKEDEIKKLNAVRMGTKYVNKYAAQNKDSLAL